MSPLTYSALRDAALRAMYEMTQAWDLPPIESGSTGYITPPCTHEVPMKVADQLKFMRDEVQTLQAVA